MDEAKIRLLLVDDQQLFVEDLKYVLESRASDIDVVGTALSGESAITCARELRPDVILMDVRMPDMDGVEATRRIKIVMLTTFSDDEYAHSTLQDGAVGYLLKDRPPKELINAIRAVYDGAVQIDPTVAEVLLHGGADSGDAEEEVARNVRTLTPREREVVYLLMQALDNRQIADHLGVAEQTARSARSS